MHVYDCRYPYEYAGGHITAAVNLWTPAQLRAVFCAGPDAPDARHAAAALGNGGRSLLVFHCEFSSQRAPAMCGPACC